MKHRIISGLLAVTLTIGGCLTPSVSAEAATKTASKAQIKEAKVAYANYLKQKDSIKKFRVIDVIGDNSPELITIDEYGKIDVHVYDREEKEVTYVYNSSEQTIRYNPTEKYIVDITKEEHKDMDFAFFQEAYIYGNNEAWEQTDCIDKSKLVALDTTYVVKFRSQDKHAGIFSYKGKEVKSGKKYEGYHSCDVYHNINGKISKATYEKKYKEFMSGTKKIKNFYKNTSANRASLKK